MHDNERYYLAKGMQSAVELSGIYSFVMGQNKHEPLLILLGFSVYAGAKLFGILVHERIFGEKISNSSITKLENRCEEI